MLPKPLDKSSLASWLNAYQVCPYATFFHSPDWYLTQQRVTNGSIHVLELAIAGQTVLIPALLTPRFRGFSQEWHIGVGSGYGGVLATRSLHVDERAYILAQVLKTCANVRWVSNPFDADVALRFPGNRVHRSQDHTQILPIDAHDAQLKRMAPERARQVRRSAEGPLSLNVVEKPSPNTVSQFLPLYQAHSAQWQFKRWVRDHTYFENFLDQAGSALTLFLVYAEGELAGFQLIARKDAIATQIHLATHRNHHHLYPGARLTHAVLEWSRANQIRHLDFLSSGALEGVSRYKAAYGSDAKPFEILTSQNWQSRALSWSARLAHSLVSLKAPNRRRSTHA